MESSSGHWLVESAGSMFDDKHWNANLCKSMQRPDKTDKCLCLKVKLDKYMQSIILAIQISNNTWMNNFNLSLVFFYRFPLKDYSGFLSRERITDCMTHTEQNLGSWGQVSCRDLRSFILACVCIWASQKERETEGIWTDLLHHPSAPNETITAIACPSAIQKH